MLRAGLAAGHRVGDVDRDTQRPAARALARRGIGHGVQPAHLAVGPHDPQLDVEAATVERRLDREVPAFVRGFLSKWWVDVMARARCSRDSEAGARGESAEAEEREEDEQRDAEAGGGEEGAVEAAAGEVLGEAEGAGPKEGDEEEEGHGVETMAGKSKEAGALTLRREGAREWVWRQKLFPSKPLPTRDCGACVAMCAK